jgi:hypothetical protein
MRIIFTNNISSISVNKRSVNYLQYHYKKGPRKIGTKFFGLFDKYEQVYGLFDWYGDYCYSVEEFNSRSEESFYDIEEDCFVYKPHCIIHTNDGKSKTVFFKTIDELNQYVEELKLLNQHIILN